VTDHTPDQLTLLDQLEEDGLTWDQWFRALPTTAAGRRRRARRRGWGVGRSRKPIDPRKYPASSKVVCTGFGGPA
jgi:hypothetical protein